MLLSIKAILQASCETIERALGDTVRNECLLENLKAVSSSATDLRKKYRRILYSSNTQPETSKRHATESSTTTYWTPQNPNKKGSNTARIVARGLSIPIS